MPEGPSLLIIRDQARKFARKTVREASGNTKTIDPGRMQRRKVVAIDTWGKHLLIRFSNFTLRVHLMMFGRALIDARKPPPASPRLHLAFDNGELNLYACSLRYIDEPLDEVYDWRADVMADAWDPALARRKLARMKEAWICDALLDQTVFAGVGNIIKNEVLYRVGVQPCSRVGAIPARKRAQIVEQARVYSFEFLAWRQANVLRKHWQVHNKGQCPLGHGKLARAYLGKTNRRSFYCPVCQVRYE